jgi:hypothetical protein
MDPTDWRQYHPVLRTLWESQLGFYMRPQPQPQPKPTQQLPKTK